MSGDSSKQLTYKLRNGIHRPLSAKEIEFIEPCVHCMSKSLKLMLDSMYQIKCLACGTTGPFGQTRGTAISLWDSLGR